MATRKRQSVGPPCLAESWSAVRDNLYTLECYRTSAHPHEQDYFKTLIHRGACFVLYDDGTRILVGPSRFVGYHRNTMALHEAASRGEKDGMETNQHLGKLLHQRFHVSQQLEDLFIALCMGYDVTPNQKAKKFVFYAAEDELGRDIADLSKKMTPETKRQQLIDARLGQGQFRKAVLEASQGRCVITGCSDARVLRASHIKPWKRSTDKERLDPNNGLALIPNADALFDRGLIGFNDMGRLLVSASLSASTRKTLGLPSKCRITVRHTQRRYLKWHREYFAL